MSDALVPPAPLAPLQPPDTNPAVVYLGRLGQRSRVTQLGALRAITAIIAPGTDPLTLPWEQMRYQHTQLVRAELARRYAPATANRLLAALRGVLTEAWRLGLMDVEASQRARDLAPIRGHREPPGRALSTDELRHLLAVCDGSNAGTRDAALLVVLYAAGVRRAEAVALDIEDYTDASILVRAGKNNKDRRQYLADFAVQRLNAWLARLDRPVGPLFVRILRGDHLTVARLTDGAVRHILHTRCLAAGVEPIAPHSMRRTYCSSLLAAGVDLSTAQALMGHASPTTTARYDRRGDERKRAAANLLAIE